MLAHAQGSWNQAKLVEAYALVVQELYLRRFVRVVCAQEKYFRPARYATRALGRLLRSQVPRAGRGSLREDRPPASPTLISSLYAAFPSTQSSMDLGRGI
jgi:hypothetical protein